MYKDKEKQREANRVSASKSRLKRIAIQKGMTEGMMEDGSSKDIISPAAMELVRSRQGVTELKFSKSAQAKGRLPLS